MCSGRADVTCRGVRGAGRDANDRRVERTTSFTHVRQQEYANSAAVIPGSRHRSGVESIGPSMGYGITLQQILVLGHRYTCSHLETFGSIRMSTVTENNDILR